MKKYLLISFSIAFAMLALAGCVKKKNAPEWKLVWSDEFDGTGLDLSKWSYETGNGYNGWGNYEQQYYTSENVTVGDGMLTITARREDMEGCAYTSGRIRTAAEDGTALFQTQYGKIEAKIAINGENGLNGIWPAFWMMPVDNYYGLWPLSGEIDIMEARGRLPYIVNGTIHYGESIPNNKFTNKEFVFENGESIYSFHIYSIEWDMDEIIWSVDGEEYFRTSNWYTLSKDGEATAYPAPFDKPFYLLLNMAVGGTYDDGVMPDENMQTAEMKVDYVRVYENTNRKDDDADRNKNSEQDVKSLARVNDEDNYINDIQFATVNCKPIQSTPEYINDKWYFLAKEYFGGNGSGELVNIDGNQYFHCKISNPGEKRYSLQLQHVIPLIKGYTYVVEFDAMSDSDRKIAFQPIGISGEETISYNSPVEFTLNGEMQHYYCSFTMKEDTDLSAVAEFNLGLENPDVYFGNVEICILS